MQDKSKLFSTAGAYYINSSVCHSMVSKEIFDKAGVDVNTDLAKAFFFIPNWDQLLSKEKMAILSVFHERRHFFDLTSLPIGTLLWRASFGLQFLVKGICKMIDNNGLGDSIVFPITEWVNDVNMTLLKSRLVQEKVFLSDFYLHNYLKAVKNEFSTELKQLHRFFDDFLNLRETDESAVRLFNQAYLAMSGVFGLGKAVPITWKLKKGAVFKSTIPDELKLSVLELLELRAYCTECISLIEHEASPEFMEEWLQNIPLHLSRVKDAITYFRNKFINMGSVFHLTDVALSGAIDFVCHFGKKPVTMDVYKEFPPYRWQVIMEALEKDPSIYFQNNEEGLIEWYKFSFDLFGYSCIPYSLFGGSVNRLLPREVAPPFRPNKLEDYINYRNVPFISAITGSQRAMFNAGHHHYNFVNLVKVNHQCYAYAYLTYEFHAFLPYFEFFSDFVCKAGKYFVYEPPADYKSGSLVWPGHDAGNIYDNEHLATFIPTIAEILIGQVCVSMFEGEESYRQIWDLEEYLEKTTNTKVEEGFFRNCLREVFPEEVLKQVNFHSLM